MILRLDTSEINGISFAAGIDGIVADSAAQIVENCHSLDTNRLLLTESHLPPEFFRLDTGFAGEIIQKCGNYFIQLAIVVHEAADYGERFSELARESKRGSGFRIFSDYDSAVEWLAAE